MKHDRLIYEPSLSSVLGSVIHLHWTIPEKKTQGIEDMEFPGLLKK